jgi:FAD/FMN-containing dehydrogenase
VLSRREALRLGAFGALGAVLGTGGRSSPSRWGPATSAIGTGRSSPSRWGPAPSPLDARRSSSRDWGALSSKLAGRLSLPGSATYPADRALYDPLYDSVRPAAVAFCANAGDVARCVDFARRGGLALAVRSGRHSYAGYSTVAGGLVVDVSPMSRAWVARDGQAVIGAGARLIDVYSALASHGLSVPAGTCPTVGFAGLALGGGIGVMDRLWGLTSDNVTALEVVTAAGEVVRADAGTNPDLYWACRGGGGGNFGVVTRFSVRTFATVELSLFVLTWPWTAAAQVLPAWMDWAHAGPDELWSSLQLSAEPALTSPAVRLVGVWAGKPAGAAAQLAQLVSAAGAPATRFVGTSSFGPAMNVEAGCEGFSEAECDTEGLSPAGRVPRRVTVAKSDIFNAPLSPAGVHAVLAGISERQRQGGPGAVLFDSWGGAVGRVPASATAFVHRRAVASAQYLAMFPAGVSAAEVRSARTWLEAWYAALRPFASGEAYQNYIDPYLRHWERAYYGSNFPRLQEVKAKWDPEDVWHFAQSIPLPGRRAVTA